MSLQNFPSFVLDFSEGNMKGENGQFYGFGRFKLDLAEQRLSDGESQIALTPKAFDVLSVLVQNAGHLVEKEELLQHVWPDSFVEESNVARIIHTLRKKLGDDGNGNSFIETVPTKGYRFVADVEVIEETSVDAADANASVEDATIEPTTVEPSAAALAVTQAETSYRRHYLILAAILVLSVLVTGFWISNGSLMPRSLSKFVRHSMNGEAYKHFQQGKFLIEQEHSPQGKQQALEHFEKAIEIDPYYAEAYAAKAAVKSGAGGRSNDDIAIARAAVKEALELNPESSYAHSVYCRIIGTEDWEFYDAVSECQLAVELDPNDAGAHRELGLALNVIGRSDEALSEIDAALTISPTSDIKRARGMVLYYARRYDDALEQFQQLVTTDPDYADGYKWLMLVFAMKNDQEKAFENLVKLDEFRGVSPEDIDAARSAFSSGGWPAAMRVTLDARTGFWTEPRFVAAELLAQIGEKDRAFAVLNEMRKERDIMMVNVYREPTLDPIRDDPRYNAILSDMHLK